MTLSPIPARAPGGTRSPALLPRAGYPVSGCEGWGTSAGGLLVPPALQFRRTRQAGDRPIGVGLFAGAGGFDLGFHQGGFHMAAAVEWDATASITYLVNLARPGVKIHFDTPEREEAFTRVLNRHLGLKSAGGNAASASAPRGQAKDTVLPRAGLLAGDGWISGQPDDEPGCEHFWVADIRNITGQMILDALGLRRGEVDVVIGGPPCQGFSVANAKRSVMDPRNSLVFEFARLVIEINPKAMVMENVPQVATMLTPEGVPVIDALARVLADGGFSGYDALKASLAAQAGAGALLRADAPKSRDKRKRVPGQGSLFDAPGEDADEED
jgi:DNA (cytosine-5)-methyltransferase 1